MAKERSVNPAQAQRKAEKKKEIKKGKAEAQSRRNEKVARRNPQRIEKQILELKGIEAAGRQLSSHEKSVLEGLESELKAVKKARETLGQSAPKFPNDGATTKGFRDRGGQGDGRGVLGKRSRIDEESSEDDDAPEDVKRIPMPRDTPPPISKEVLDRWYSRRREKMGVMGRGSNVSGNANMTPLGQGRGITRPQEPVVVEARTTYEAKPVVRDLRKEAIAFMPVAVRAKVDKARGSGGLVEPEEADRLEREGYMRTRTADPRGRNTDVEEGSKEQGGASRVVSMEEVEDGDA